MDPWGPYHSMHGITVIARLPINPFSEPLGIPRLCFAGLVIKRFVITPLIQKQILEGVKEKLRFFNDHVVEVKSVAKGQSGNKSSQLSIYDFKNGITLYWTNAHASILEVEIENDAIYYLAENSTGGDKTERVLVKLYEMEDNVKIHTLMKKGLYTEAEQIARDANFPREI